MIAYCWRSGEIEFGDHEPYGTIGIIDGPDAMVRDVITSQARHGYDGTTLLVPGVPDAGNDSDAAVQAVLDFVDRCREAMAARGHGHTRQ